MSNAEYTGFDAHVEELTFPDHTWRWVMHDRNGRAVEAYRGYTTKRGAREALERHLHNFNAYLKPHVRDKGWYHVFKWV